MTQPLHKFGIALVVVIILGFAYYTISPVFITTKMDEPLPTPDASQENASAKTAVIVDTPAHPASGVVRIVESDGKRYIRYENFKTLNGPDIFVYLANDLNAKDFVNLGRVKATEGNVNYEIPEGVDVSEYRYVMVWCKAFGVLFNYADLSHLK